MSSGFSFLPANDPAGHTAAPKTGTYATAKGEHVSPRQAACPLYASCAICGGRIRLDHPMQLEWIHDLTASAGGAP